METLNRSILTCTKCPLHTSRRNAVPGEGPPDASIMIVGEAPGRFEDEKGRPFVGPAGKILDSLLESAGLERRKVFITNVVKCRPPGNRDPKEEEIAACLPYLEDQIRALRPKLIIALGRHAGRTLYSMAGMRWPNISRARGRAVDVTIAGVKTRLVVTFHPAASLYNPGLRRGLEEDFKVVIRREAQAAMSMGEGASGTRGLDAWLRPDSGGSGESPGGDV